MATKYQKGVAYRSKMRRDIENKPKVTVAQLLEGKKQGTLKEILECLCLLLNAGYRKSNECQNLFMKFEARVSQKISLAEIHDAFDYVKPTEMTSVFGLNAVNIRTKLRGLLI